MPRRLLKLWRPSFQVSKRTGKKSRCKGSKSNWPRPSFSNNSNCNNNNNSSSSSSSSNSLVPNWHRRSSLRNRRWLLLHLRTSLGSSPRLQGRHLHKVIPTTSSSSSISSLPRRNRLRKLLELDVRRRSYKMTAGT